MTSSPRFLSRVLARLQAWVDRGWSGRVVYGWGLAQGLVFPGVADLFFLPLALARPQQAYRLALIATAGTLTGSIVLYWAGAEALLLLEGPLARFFNLTPAALEVYRTRLAEYGGWAIFASTMSPLSTKLTSIASGAIGVPFTVFTSALLLGRLTRTLGLAWLVRHGGAEMVERWAGRGERGALGADRRTLPDRSGTADAERRDVNGGR